MAGQFRSSLGRVAAVHAGVVALVIGWPSLSLFRRPAELTVPVEFVVELPGDAGRRSESDVLPVPPPARQEDVIPEPAPPRRTQVVRSTARVVRDQGPRRPTLSPEEIRGLLEMGARPGDHTSIPGEEQMCLELIRRRLYDAWTQPSSAEAAGATAEVRLRLLPGGVLGERAMVRGSGNPAVDASVMEAVNAVRSVQGLTTEFLRRHETVVIAFRVE